MDGERACTHTYVDSLLIHTVLVYMYQSLLLVATGNHVTIHIIVVTKLASCIGMHIRRWRWDCSPTESNPNSKNSNKQLIVVACMMSKSMADWWCYHLFDLHQAKQTKTKVLSSTGSSWVRLLQLYQSIFQIEQTKEKQSRYDIAGLTSCSQITYTSLGHIKLVSIYLYLKCLWDKVIIYYKTN